MRGVANLRGRGGVNKMTELKFVGQRLVRVDAIEKATGKAMYLDDYAFPRMLCGRILRSPVPHARIRRIDTSKARRLAGVKAVITGDDLPDLRYGAYVKDTPVLTKDKVRFVGEPVAAVAALDEDVAAEALELIEVEYEELTPVFDPLGASEPGVPLIHENWKDYAVVFEAIREGNLCSRTIFQDGDIEQGFRRSDEVFENTFVTRHVHQCHLEANGAIASVDASGRVTVWTTTQSVHLNQIRISEGLGIPMNKIRVIGTKVGGGFGAKIEPTVQPVCVALAQRTFRPVKIVLTREEEFTSMRPRHGSVIHIKTGVTREGLILAREVNIIYDTGAYADDGPGIAAFGGLMSLGPYRVPNYRIDSRCVYTNKVPTGAFRGFGNPQCTFAFESQMDIIAKELGIDPLELRLKNACENGDRSVGGIVMRSVGVKECLKKAAEEAGWGKPRAQNRGVGMACMQHISGVLSSSATVRINDDGTATVSTGTIDIGQGSDTILIQIAAEELGIPADQIALITADTDATPYNWAMSASRTTYTVGNAVKAAAADAKQQLLELAANVLEANPADLYIEEGKVKVKGSPGKGIAVRELGAISNWAMGGPIVGKNSFMVSGHVYDPAKVKGMPFGTFAGFIFGAHVVEVEVDPETGNVRVVKGVAAHDVGRAVNPTTVEGQIEGGFAQGVGFALFEEMMFEKGSVINPNLLDYKIPTAMDLPKVRALIVEETEPTGPFGAKGVGEPGLVATAPAIANAICDATGVRLYELPMNPERLQRALSSSER